MKRILSTLLLGLLCTGACVSAVPDSEGPGASKEGRLVWALREEVERLFEAELLSATALDGINTNVLRVNLRSRDKTLDERVETARKVAAFFKERGAIPAGQYRMAFDFPVSFQVGCMPVSLYERVQLELLHLTPIQKLPAQRILANDNLTRGAMGLSILDDTQWNLPFFLRVDAVEVAKEVNGVQAKPDEMFVSVHTLWTNVGTHTATMSDDPWRLVDATLPVPAPVVEGSDAPAAKAPKPSGDLVALLDGDKATHLGRNGGLVKMPPVDPGKTQGRWYVYRVPLAKLERGIAWARQRYAKATSKDKEWTKAGFELWVDVKAPSPVTARIEPGHPHVAFSPEWNGLVDAAVDARAAELVRAH